MSSLEPTSPHTRRHFLRRLASGVIVATGGALLVSDLKMDSAAFAEALAQRPLTQTPWQTEGPFYPDHLPLDRDNDLVIVKPGITPAIGEITQLSGRVTDTGGEPVRGVRVEIWQVDHNGAYIHSRNGNGTHDKFFQGYGRFETDKNGEYRFRTVKPVPYPGRTPHIHLSIWKGQRELLATQVYVRGHPQNARDDVLNGIRDTRQRQAVQVPFVPIKGSKIGELAARFNIVLGWTPSA